MIKFRLLRRWSLILVMMILVQGAFSQAEISGTVFDPEGYELADVSVRDVETGEVLDLTLEAGEFVFNVPGDKMISFSRDGYRTRTVKASEVKKKQLIILEKDPFDQIIDVGYGDQPHRSNTAAISSISGEEVYKTPVPTLSNGLMGRLPGLTVMQESGEPGYDEPSMMIRGEGTYNDAGYLVYVDGFEAPFEQLSALEIESISVLKDAAALAMFGIRGANGVIWVTTKRGEAGQTKVQFDARTGFQSPTKIPDFLNSYDYARLYNEALVNDFGAGSEEYSQEELEAYRENSDPYLYPNVDWYDEVLKERTSVYDANLSFSGGNESVRYYVLMGYMRNQGLYANTDEDQEINSNADFQRYNFRSNVDIDINEIFESRINLGGRIEDRSSPNFDGPELWNNMAQYPPNIYPVKTENGEWGGNSIYPDNPVASVLARGYRSTHDRDLQATFYLGEKLDMILPGLKLTQTVSFSNWFRGNYDKTRDYARYQPYQDSETGEIEYQVIGEDTDFSINEWNNSQWHRTNLEAGLEYDRKFGEHNLSGLLMYHQDKYLVDGDNVPYAHQGIKGRLAYGFMDRYFGEFGFAYNGSENFPEGNKFGFFPALSGGWIISEESFMDGIGAIDYLKIRSSYGLLGNDRLGSERFPYEYDFYHSGGYHLGTNGNRWVNALVEGSLGNSDVTWEKSHKFNVGIEGRFFGHLDATIDLFHEKRTDILGTRSGTIPALLGAGLPSENFGEVTNKGVEADLMFRDRIGDFSYFAGTKFWFIRNTIEYMDEVERPENYLYRTGKSIDQVFGLEAVGFFDSWEEIEDPETPDHHFGTVQPGDIRYKDQNDDGVINEDDEVAIGHGWDPEITYSFNLGASYKGFDLEFFFQGVANRSVYRSGADTWAFVDNAKVAPNALGRWTEDNKESATYPRLTTTTNENNYRTSTFWMENGAFLRLRNVELGYTLPNATSQQLGIKKARIFVNGINQLTWDHVGNLDPEVMSGYPLMKSWNMGITVNF